MLVGLVRSLHGVHASYMSLLLLFGQQDDAYDQYMASHSVLWTAICATFLAVKLGIMTAISQSVFPPFAQQYKPCYHADCMPLPCRSSMSLQMAVPTTLQLHPHLPQMIGPRLLACAHKMARPQTMSLVTLASLTLQGRNPSYASSSLQT